MLVADGTGIIVVVVLCKHIPQRTIKWFSAGIFVIFGLAGVYEVLSVKIALVYTGLILLLLIASSVSAMIILARKQRQNEKFNQDAVCKSKPA
jgi:predicted membrane channel-forming protein YqfA (hemolysin III family)